MRFVILSRSPIPGFGVSGPILSPAQYDIHLVLRWIGAGVDVREVMEDGSYRRLRINDERLIDELNRKIEKQAAEREAIKKQIEDERRRPAGIVQLIPEKNRRKPAVKKAQPKVEPKREEPKVEPPKPVEVEEEKVDLFIDELERPE